MSSINNIAKNALSALDSATIGAKSTSKQAASEGLEKTKSNEIRTSKSIRGSVIQGGKKVVIGGGRVAVTANPTLQAARVAGHVGAHFRKSVHSDGSQASSSKAEDAVSSAATLHVAKEISDLSSKVDDGNTATPQQQQAVPPYVKDADVPLSSVKTPAPAEIKKTPKELQEMAIKSGYIRKEIITTEKKHQEGLSKGIAGLTMLKGLRDDGKIETKLDLDKILKDFRAAKKASEELSESLEGRDGLTNEDVGKHYQAKLAEYGKATSECASHTKDLEGLLSKFDATQIKGKLGPEWIEKYKKALDDEMPGNTIDISTFGSVYSESNTGFAAAFQRIGRHPMLLTELENNSDGSEKEEVASAKVAMKALAENFNSKEKIKYLQTVINNLVESDGKLKIEGNELVHTPRQIIDLRSKAGSSEDSKNAMTTLLGGIESLASVGDDSMKKDLKAMITNLEGNKWAKATMAQDKNLVALYERCKDALK